MASLELDTASGRYRYGGQEFKRSLRTKSRRVADASLGQVEEVLRMLEIVLVAPTGMCRSELLQAKKEDSDFQERTISVRDKKRSRKHALSFR